MTRNFDIDDKIGTVQNVSLYTLRDLKSRIEKHFGVREINVFYNFDIQENLENRIINSFPITLPKTNEMYIMLQPDHIGNIRFDKNYTPDDVALLIKQSVIQNPLYFGNAVSIRINTPEQKKYVDALKKGNNVVREYKESDNLYD